MAHNDKGGIAVASEGSGYAVDPSGDGSGYAWIQCEEAPLGSWDRSLEPANYATGRARHYGEHVSSDAASLQLSISLRYFAHAGRRRLAGSSPVIDVRNCRDRPGRRNRGGRQFDHGANRFRSIQHRGFDHGRRILQPF